MPNFMCPHCHQESISARQKFFLNAVNSSRCQNCGASLGSSLLWNAFATVPYFVLIVLLQNDPEVIVVITTLLAAISVSLIIHFAGPIKLDKKPLAET